MGKLIDKFRKFRDKQKLKARMRSELREVDRREASEKRQKRIKEQTERLEERSDREASKQIRIAKVREAQLRRAKAETGIIKAREQRVRSRLKIRRQIVGKPFQISDAGRSTGFRQPPKRLQPQQKRFQQRPPQMSQRSVTGFGGPPTQRSNVGGALLDFGQPRQQKQVQKKKTGIGIGQNFRVL